MSTPSRFFRIGIDVGGTFTKAVIIESATNAVVGRYSVMTTHDHPRGVAHGVIEVFRGVLAQSGVAPSEVAFIAHSTTQATNALLEGDVATVGVVGMSNAAAAHLAGPQVRVDPIELAPGRWLQTCNQFVTTDELTDDTLRAAIQGLKAEGAGVLVASAAFGVDNTGSEETVRRLGDEVGLPSTCGYEITRLYGLAKRTRTAVINASILPRMMATATLTETSVREAGISAPLMIMRGDGGVMDAREMRRRPAMTMLSGPAASVAGALMHLRVSDGIYFEVGGTSTNIGVIRNGRPTVTYARVGGHETYINSLDVRVIGIAGGSLIRAEAGRLVDVGPRSAHIAGLPYAAFADAADIVAPVLEHFEPKAGDGANHVAIRVASGKRYALTTTCAANALGYAKPGMHASGNREAARKAFGPLAELLGVSVDAAATAVLDCAASKAIPVVEHLIKEYELDADQCLLIGEGGGAGSIIPFVAERTGFKYEISKDAEVISSIGVALALVRETIERIVPHPKPEDLVAIREEAKAAVIRLGADPQDIEVTVDVDTLTHRVRATAMGAAEMHAKGPDQAIAEREARSIAARSLGLEPAALVLKAETPGIRIYQTGEGEQASVRAVDWQGALKAQRSRAMVRAAIAADAGKTVSDLWKVGHALSLDGRSPGLLLMYERHVLDLSGVESLDQALALTGLEVAKLDPKTPVAMIALL